MLFDAYGSNKRKLLALSTFAGAAWISIGTTTMDARLRREKEKQKRFPVLKTIGMLNYDDG